MDDPITADTSAFVDLADLQNIFWMYERFLWSAGSDVLPEFGMGIVLLS